MTALLSKLPYLAEPDTVLVGGERVRLKDHQIIVWISIGAADAPDLAPDSPRLPAILDTGNNFTFSIRAAQLRQWAGIDQNYLGLLGSIRHLGRNIPTRAAHVWLHRNRTGERDAFTDQPPYRLRLKRGIAIYPQDMPQAPRLPLLGLRALEENHLHLKVNAERRRVSLRSPDWVTRLFGWW
jgi:hypothetical protein